MAGCDYPIYSEKGKIEKIISFKGGCYANDISTDDFNALKKAYPSFIKAIDEGYIVVNDSKVNTQKIVDDTKQEAVNKQNSKRKAAANATNVEVTEA